MDFTLRKEHEMARSLFREFAEKEVKPLAQEVDETEEFPRETARKMAKNGFLGIPVPKEDALAYICPVCLWENDVFDPGEDQPSDENRGMTLAEGREAYKKLGAVREEFLKYARKPLPEELP